MSDTDYFGYGPVNQGTYDGTRDNFDSALGWLDGVSGLANSIGRTVGSVADMRQDWAEGQAAHNQVALDREAAEQALVLENFKVRRGDNIQLYYALAAAAVVLILVMK